MRANWHQQVAADPSPEVDPFNAAHFAGMTDTANNVLDAVPANSMTICSPVSMPPISLDTPTAELRGNLESLIRREARLFDEGMTCELKDQGDMSCLACPINHSEEDDEPMQALCRIGMAQEVTLAHLLAQRASGG